MAKSRNKIVMIHLTEDEFEGLDEMAKADDRPTGQLARLIVARAVAAGRPRKEPVTFKSAARQVPPPPHVKAEESTA